MSFTPYCGNCVKVIPKSTGCVLSCSCFICSACEPLFQNENRQCPGCGKLNAKFKALRAGADLGEEINSNLRDLTEQMENTHNTLIFQTKHYKKMLSKAGATIENMNDCLQQKDITIHQLKQQLSVYLQHEQHVQQQNQQQFQQQLYPSPIMDQMEQMVHRNQLAPLYNDRDSSYSQVVHVDRRSRPSTAASAIAPPTGMAGAYTPQHSQPQWSTSSGNNLLIPPPNTPTTRSSSAAVAQLAPHLRDLHHAGGGSGHYSFNNSRTGGHDTSMRHTEHAEVRELPLPQGLGPDLDPRGQLRESAPTVDTRPRLQELLRSGSSSDASNPSNWGNDGRAVTPTSVHKQRPSTAQGWPQSQQASQQQQHQQQQQQQHVHLMAAQGLSQGGGQGQPLAARPHTSGGGTGGGPSRLRSPHQSILRSAALPYAHQSQTLQATKVTQLQQQQRQEMQRFTGT